MVIGSVLLQPRKVAVTATPSNLTLLEDLIALVVRLLWDRAHGGACLGLVETALGISLARMRDGMKSGEATALQKVKAWVQPFLDRVTALGKALPEESSPHAAIESGDQLVGLIVDMLDGVTTDELSKHLDFLLKVVQDDLGLTNTVIAQATTAIFGDILAQLRGAPPEQDIVARENRLEIIALIRRIGREIEGKFTLPPINVDRLAAPLLSQLGDLEYDAFLQRLDVIGKSVKSGLDLVGTISDVVPFSMGFGDSGPGAAAPAGGAKHAWYASWLAQDDVSADDPATASTLKPYSFKHVDAATMEKIALHSRWITTLADFGLVAGTGMKRGNFAVTSMSLGRDTIYTLLAPLADIEFPSGTTVSKLVDILIDVGVALLGSLEGRSLNSYDAVLYFFRFLFKFGGTSFPVDLVRDALLSIMTLANHDDTAATPPENRNQVDGLIELIMRVVGPLILAGALPDTYFSINVNVDNASGNARHPVGILLAAILLGALGMSVLTFFITLVIGAGIAGAFPDAGTAAKSWAKGWGLSHITFIGFWFLLNDGATKDGKRGYIPDEGRGTEVAFDGYADNSASPYLLPFENDAECVQGNHGFWSHNSITNQLFAYDFSLNLGQDVLCMRDGEVESVLDTTDDGDHGPDGNHIVIKHTTQDPTHDKDVNGAARTTYARYYHGQKGSIQAAFPGGLPSKGTAVKQGQLLMTCNSTGMSRFNHVHVDVMPDNGSGAPKDYSIPFVFKDASDKGVPKSRTVYDSANTKK